jgi:hypothetical protein|tara:strand:- start:146 stop:337 length:192 start_codon:yes stop_codon:yes gene_type:complete
MNIEKLLKDKLAKNGINQKWMNEHLIIDTITDDDINEIGRERGLHPDDDRDAIINIIEESEND